MGKTGSKWREDRKLQTTVGGSGGDGRLRPIGHKEVDDLRLKLTVTVNSPEGYEIRRGPLYTGKAGQLNVGSRVPGVYPVVVGC